MKRVLPILVAIVLLTTSKARAQEFYIEPKINVAAAAVALFNPAIEFGWGARSAFQVEYWGAYAKNNYMGSGAPLILNMAMAEYRAYLLNKEHKGLFAGFDFGLHHFKAEKKVLPFLPSDHGDVGVYDWGYGFVLGVNVGYKFLFKERFGLEIFAAFGWQHTQHEQYNGAGDMLYSMNGSAEWVPYKGGVSFSYRFGKR